VPSTPHVRTPWHRGASGSPSARLRRSQDTWLGSSRRARIIPSLTHLKHVRCTFILPLHITNSITGSFEDSKAAEDALAKHPSSPIDELHKKALDAWPAEEHASKPIQELGEATNPEKQGEGEGEGESEQDSSQQAAYDPVTGKINWDCPCLGGMAHGPCGMQFREAFSCFIFSEVEPKGIDCVEKFQAMQQCFRDHPEVYGEGTCFLCRYYMAA
jgi:hypothetical protein